MQQTDIFVKLWLPRVPYTLELKGPVRDNTMKSYIDNLVRVYYVHLSALNPLWKIYGDSSNLRVLPTTLNDVSLNVTNYFWFNLTQTINVNTPMYIEGNSVLPSFNGTVLELYKKLQLPFNLARLDFQKIRNIIYDIKIVDTHKTSVEDKKQGYTATLLKDIPPNVILNIQEIDGDIDNLFPPTKSQINRLAIQYTRECVYSITSPKHASILLNTLKEMKLWLNNKPLSQLIVTDATANCGGFVLNMASEFKEMNAVEIDKMSFDVLKNNVNVYQLSNVKLINDDYLKVKHTLVQDIILIDPPWGGVDYKKEDAPLKLVLGDQDVSQIVNSIRKYAKLIVLKTPLNFDIDAFKLETKTLAGGVRIKIAGNIQYILIRGYKN